MLAIKIESPNPNIRQTYYSAFMPRAMTLPTLYNDADGSARHARMGMSYTNGGFQYYTTFSLWDTFRVEHPLLTPGRAAAGQ